MGLKDYREFKKKQMINTVIDSFLSSLNITKEDLKNIPNIKKEIESLKLENEKLCKTLTELKEVNKPIEFTQEDQKSIEEKNKNHANIEDIVKSYQGKSEEFYPYGKPREAKDN